MKIYKIGTMIPKEGELNSFLPNNITPSFIILKAHVRRKNNEVDVVVSKHPLYHQVDVNTYRIVFTQFYTYYVNEKASEAGKPHIVNTEDINGYEVTRELSYKTKSEYFNVTDLVQLDLTLGSTEKSDKIKTHGQIEVSYIDVLRAKFNTENLFATENKNNLLVHRLYHDMRSDNNDYIDRCHISVAAQPLYNEKRKKSELKVLYVSMEFKESDYATICTQYSMNNISFTKRNDVSQTNQMMETKYQSSQDYPRGHSGTQTGHMIQQQQQQQPSLPNPHPSRNHENGKRSKKSKKKNSRGKRTHNSKEVHGNTPSENTHPISYNTQPKNPSNLTNTLSPNTERSRVSYDRNNSNNGNDPTLTSSVESQQKSIKEFANTIQKDPEAVQPKRSTRSVPIKKKKNTQNNSMRTIDLDAFEI